MRAPQKRTPGGNLANADQTKQSTAIVSQAEIERKQLQTLAAEAALQGREVIALPDGRYLLCRWGWCQLFRRISHLARAVERGMS